MTHDCNTPHGEVCNRLVEVDCKVATLERNDEDKERRMRDLERTIWRAVGAVGILNGIFVAAMAILEYFKK
jgi:hypothetical protein